MHLFLGQNSINRCLCAELFNWKSLKYFILATVSIGRESQPLPHKKIYSYHNKKTLFPDRMALKYRFWKRDYTSMQTMS